MSITNLDYLRSFSENDTVFIVEMVEMFLDNTPTHLDEMKSHLQNNNFREIGRVAHKMKPSVSFMGMESAKKLVLHIEKNIPENADQKEASEKIEELVDLCEIAFKELKISLSDLKK